MIGEEYIIEVHLASLLAVYEIPVGVVQGVKGKACQVHGHEIEVHPLDANLSKAYFLCRKFS